MCGFCAETSSRAMEQDTRNQAVKDMRNQAAMGTIVGQEKSKTQREKKIQAGLL